LTNFALTTKLPTLLVSNWSIGFLALAAFNEIYLKISNYLLKKAEEFTNPSILDLANVFFLMQLLKDLEFVEVL
jgi:hypothetical protein